MKFAIVFACFFAAAIAAPVGDGEAEILRYDSDNIGTGEYNWNFETTNGIKGEESGHLVPSQSEAGESISVKGSFSFVADDGQTYTVTYIADENGFQPEGHHLPIA
ncbi:hypothetical protein ACFFRR_011803 [Megaselia abdita]